MTARQLAHIICRALAVYYVVEFIRQSAVLWQLSAYSRQKLEMFSFLPEVRTAWVLIITYAAAAFVLWDRAGWISELVAGPDQEGTGTPAPPNWNTLAYRLLGLYIAIGLIPGAIQAYCRAFPSQHDPEEGAQYLFWAYVAILIVSLFVALGGSRIKAALHGYWNISEAENERPTTPE